jgi:diguanylate cyclase (GGDEF)-like protein
MRDRQSELALMPAPVLTQPAVESELSRLSARNQLLSSLNSITVELVNRTELTPLLQHIAMEIKSLLKADLVQINMVHESGSYLETVCSAGDWMQGRHFRYTRREGANGMAWDTRSVQYIDNYESYSNRLEGLDAMSCCVAIPLFRDRMVIGTIDVTFASDNLHYREKAVANADVLEQISQLTTVAIENASLHESTMATLGKTVALNELSQLIHSKSDLDDVLSQSADMVLSLSDSLMVSIMQAADGKICCHHTLFHDQTTVTVCAGKASENDSCSGADATSGDLSSNISAWGKLSNISAARHCLETGNTIVLSHSEPCEQEAESVTQWRSEQQIGPSLYLPLVHEQDTYGVLAIHRHINQRKFSDADLNLLTIAANQISIAIYQSSLLAKIRHDAYHDGLTQLPNRMYFEKQLADAIDSEQGKPGRFAVLFMDLDGFKSVNDTLGHGIGDKLLRNVSDRLTANLRDGDLLVRLGGDEFAVLLQNLTDRETAMAIAARLNQSLQHAADIDGYKITISVSIGLSFYPTDGETADELLKNADIAMYQAKGTGKNRINCFDEQMALKYRERVQLESDLREALDSDQLFVVYQPQIEPHSGRVVTVEALARWNHPVLGSIPPDKFIPIAEESGLITRIGERVLREACKQTRQLQKKGYPRLHIAVNISAQQFAQDDFESAVFNALRHSGLQAGYLELEITENIAMENVDRVIAKLDKLRARGIQIAIDDFGTGYSSLRYLEDLPLDTLKIDRSFVEKLDPNDPQHSLVNTIILMASSFGITTVAEGVETRAQLQSVVELGCDYIQGYYYSKPVPASALPSVMDRINTSSNSPAPGRLAAA